MARRVNLPSADDLFRPTVAPEGAPGTPGARAPDVVGKPRRVRAVPDAPAEQAAADAATAKRPSGRVRHDEKMTVYVTGEELLEIESARLVLRSRHGLAVDRGRLVREAVSMVLADLEAHGGESALVRRLTEE
ncbi:hypothetical protein [Nocardioides nanhaiensis]|uniref:Cobyrinic acid a,c-diamide synthase n=1 Tax=Nocardioides nanhaiensis TaxID=1476871 RepID=A0ABP8WP80_9ACTN